MERGIALQPFAIVTTSIGKMRLLDASYSVPDFGLYSRFGACFAFSIAGQ
jgi:hypothetical protein